MTPAQKKVLILLLLLPLALALEGFLLFKLYRLSQHRKQTILEIQDTLKQIRENNTLIEKKIEEIRKKIS